MTILVTGGAGFIGANFVLDWQTPLRPFYSGAGLGCRHTLQGGLGRAPYCCYRGLAERLLRWKEQRNIAVMCQDNWKNKMDYL